MGQNQAGVSAESLGSSEFWVLSYPEVLKDTCRALSENPKLRTQNSELKTSSPARPARRAPCGLDSLQTIPVFYRDCVPSFLAV